ncbi:MAG: tetratricopeptide repeat protein [Candidatus Omnitrophica bacterium]|nr:tetratricopeptide repeat protein [Candidatus Omnitrophota bacterium]
MLNARLKLDALITYGTQKKALLFARKCLVLAKRLEASGEIEYFKGQVDLVQKKFAAAIEHFDAAIRFNPRDGAAYNDRALCMVELGIIDEALPYFDKGIEVEPDYATIYHNKGWLLNNIGKHREAIACFNKALALEPGRAVTYDNLADALYNCSDIKGAIQAYETVLTLLPRNACRGIRREIVKRLKELRTSDEFKNNYLAQQ